jgi:hypothetical protein
MFAQSTRLHIPASVASFLKNAAQRVTGIVATLGILYVILAVRDAWQARRASRRTGL